MYNKGYSCKHKAPLQFMSRAAFSVDLQGLGENDYWQVKPYC